MKALIDAIRSALAPVLVIAAGVAGLQFIPEGDPATQAIFSVIDSLKQAPQLLAIVAVELLSRAHQRQSGDRKPFAEIYTGLGPNGLLIVICLNTLVKAATPLGLIISIFFVRF